MNVDIVRYNRGNIELLCKTAAYADMLHEKLIAHGHKVTKDPTNPRVLFLHDPLGFVPADQLPRRGQQITLPEANR